MSEIIRQAIEQLAVEGIAVQEGKMPFPNAVAMEAIDDAIPWHPGNFYVQMMGPRLRMRWEFDKKRQGINGLIKMTKVYNRAPWVSENYHRLPMPEVVSSYAVSADSP